MTDRTQVLTVVLDKQYRTDDVQQIIDAVLMIKGVQSADINVADTTEYMAIETAKADLRQKLYEVLK